MTSVSFYLYQDEKNIDNNITLLRKSIILCYSVFRDRTSKEEQLSTDLLDFYIIICII